jgi:hypothetical protein
VHEFSWPFPIDRRSSVHRRTGQGGELEHPMDGRPGNVQEIGQRQKACCTFRIYIRKHRPALYGKGRTPEAFLVFNARWHIHKNTGTIAHLIQNDRRKEVYRPESLTRQEFFLWLHPGKWSINQTLKM